MKKTQKLSLKEINTLRLLCLKNAGELIEEAKLLLNARRYPRALVLSEIAVEELAKIPMLVGYVNRRVNKLPSRKEFSRRWTNHVNKKMSAGSFFGTSMKELGIHASAANVYKNFGLYVDLTIKGPMMPRDIIGKGLATRAYIRASTMCKEIKQAEKIIGPLGREHVRHFKNDKDIKFVNDLIDENDKGKVAEILDAVQSALAGGADVDL